MPVFDEDLEPNPGFRPLTDAEKNAEGWGAEGDVDNPVDQNYVPETPITNDEGEILGEVPLDGEGKPLKIPTPASLAAMQGNPTMIAQQLGSMRVKQKVVTWQIYRFSDWKDMLYFDEYQEVLAARLAGQQGPRF